MQVSAQYYLSNYRPLAAAAAVPGWASPQSSVPWRWDDPTGCCYWCRTRRGCLHGLFGLGRLAQVNQGPAPDPSPQVRASKLWSESECLGNRGSTRTTRRWERWRRGRRGGKGGGDGGGGSGGGVVAGTAVVATLGTARVVVRARRRRRRRRRQ